MRIQRALGEIIDAARCQENAWPGIESRRLGLPVQSLGRSIRAMVGDVDTPAGPSRTRLFSSTSARDDTATNRHDRTLHASLPTEQGMPLGWSSPIWIWSEGLVSEGIPSEKVIRSLDATNDASDPTTLTESIMCYSHESI